MDPISGQIAQVESASNNAPSLKAKVAIEAIKGNNTVAQIAQTFSVHPNLLAFWKKQAIEHLPSCFR
jgi:transposase-like protein